MPGVMCIMCIDHALEVAALLFQPHADPLMNDDVVKDQVEKTVAENTDGDADQIRVVIDEGGVIEERYARKTEHQSKKVVALCLVVMNSMMRLVPAPQEPVHDEAVREPCNKLPCKECSNDD